MNALISVRELWAVLVALCAGVLIAYGAFGQQPQPERLTFVLTAQLTGPLRQNEPARELGDHPVEVRAGDYNSSYVRSALLTVMPASIAVGDFDSDGNPDLYVAGAGWPNLLLQGTRDGGFRDVTDLVSAGGQGASLSAAFSDYDHSGRQSLFVAGTEGITLYCNNGNNSFSEATQKSGLRTTPGVLCTSVALGDLDGDGFPDLLVTAYTDLANPPMKPLFTFPNDFPGAASQLYRNNGNGTFTDVTESSGLGKNPGRARKAIFADFNNDQRLDILLLRDDKPPVLYLNRGGWKFEDATWEAGDDLTTHAFFEGALADFNRDGKPDLAIWSTHSFRLLINQGNAKFERSDSAHMPEPAISLFGFRGAAADLDDNRFVDVVTVDQAGHLRAFANHSGAFLEVLLALPPGLEVSSLASVRWRGSPGTHLLVMQPDGRIGLLGRKSGGLSR